MNIKPIGERVLIQPKTANEKKKLGTVIAAGTDKDGNPLRITIGETVLYRENSSEEFEIEGEKYIIIDYKDLLAKIN